ncbi:hypothetical protein U1Q18_021472 [Sarracenia purpurea var. burkii]
MDSTRNPSFIQEDDGLASLAEMESDFSENGGRRCHRRPTTFFSRPHYPCASQSPRTLSFSSASGSPRSGRFYDGGRYENQRRHFLEACFLCKKPLAVNKDIFMYRGDTPFCSEECRQVQIENDEAKEKNQNLSAASMKALRKDQKKSNSTSPNRAQDYPFPTGTMAAA